MKNGGFWDFSEFTANLYRALEKAGLNERDRVTGRYKIHIHSTRKFSALIVDWMML